MGKRRMPLHKTVEIRLHDGLSIDVNEIIEKYSLLNFFTLFTISIIYTFTNKYFEIKVHQYFYYFFDLNLHLTEYEKGT